MADVALKNVLKSAGSVVQFVASASSVADPLVMVLKFVILPESVSFPAAALPVKLIVSALVLETRLKAPVFASKPPVVVCCRPPIPVE